MTLRNRAFLAVVMLAAASCATMGCELLVSFDRSLIDAGAGPEDGGEDGETPVDSGSPEAAADSSPIGKSDAGDAETPETSVNGEVPLLMPMLPE